MACDRKIGPFDCCSVVHGDCLELMKQLPLVCECGADVSGEGGIFHAVGGHANRYPIDAIVTDPPYGIGVSRMTLGNRKGAQVLRCGNWDDKPADVAWIVRLGIPAIIWGGNYFDVPPSRGWLVWDKGTGSNDFADCELAWTNLDSVVRKHFRSWVGANAKESSDTDRFHPTQKPVSLMTWCIEQTHAETILDPFCGSGTTLVAAKKLGRHFLGFEISPEYCEIARDRLARIDAQPTLFEPKPEQMQLGGE